MQDYRAENMRNVVLLSHTGAGKTSLAEALLYNSGAITRLGRVDDGNTTSDYDPDETRRQSSINLSVLPLEWKGSKVNIIDTPGYADFVGEVGAALRVADAAVIVICAVSGVEVGTEQFWSYSDKVGLPRLIFVNKIDREHADFHKTVAQIQAKFGRKCIPVQLPIGSQDSFAGTVDLLSRAPSSPEVESEPFRDRLVEAVAEADDDLATKYLEGEELTEDELRSGLRAGVISGAIVPILVGTALNNKGIPELLNAICEYLPSPKDRGKIIARDLNTGQEIAIEPDGEGPLAAFVFKTSADPYVGKLNYFRVYSGTLRSDSTVWNAGKGRAERIGQLYTIRGKAQEPTAQVSAGDLGAVSKLAETGTGDSLCTQARPLAFAPISFPAPSLSVAVHPKTKADVDKLGTALSRLGEEDPSLSVRREPDTGETILSGLGEAHLEVAVERMRRKLGVDADLELPKIPYKETITATTKAEYKHKKQTGGHGQYGHVFLELEPLSRGAGYEFADRVVGGAIPKNYIPGVEKGVHEALQEGVVAGYPVVDVKITLYDGSYHPVDSSDISFKIAGAHALRKGVAQAQPVLLEPIMNVRITTPEDFTGDIIGDLNGKRARILGMNPQNGSNLVEAQVPLSEMLRYATELRSMTQARGSFVMEFSHYEEVPANITQRIIAESKKETGKS
jgi:elongation factor G